MFRLLENEGVEIIFACRAKRNLDFLEGAPHLLYQGSS